MTVLKLLLGDVSSAQVGRRRQGLRLSWPEMKHDAVDMTFAMAHDMRHKAGGLKTSQAGFVHTAA